MKAKPGDGATLNTGRRVSVLVLLMLVGFIGAGFNTYVILRDANYDQRYLELTGEMRLYAQQLANSAREAALGDAASFDTLARLSVTSAARSWRKAVNLPSPAIAGQ